MDFLGGFLAQNITTGSELSGRRTILHSDLNNFYASVECMKNPKLRSKPVAVCGDASSRHGIVLAKNYNAKAYGVKTAEAIWQAKQKCPNLVVVPPDYGSYMKFSKYVKNIYRHYSPRVESFGLDECWIDLTGCESLFGGGEAVANEIRNRVRAETGLTVSVGVSFNKVFAKLGSDMKKPDATTVIPFEGFREQLWGMSADELLFIGRSTYKQLSRYGILTIGDVARADISVLRRLLGKNGATLHCFANGLDTSPVQENDLAAPIKTIGNSMTAPRDIVSDEDARIVLYKLADKVAGRLRENDFTCKCVQVHIRDNELEVHEFQTVLDYPVSDSDMLALVAMELYFRNKPERPVRSVGIRTSNLMKPDNLQLSLYPEEQHSERSLAIDCALDRLRGKYGKYSVGRGIYLLENEMNFGVVQGIM